MREYKHKGCASVLWMHIADGPRRGDHMSTVPWRNADGQRLQVCKKPRALCPDCNELVDLSPLSVVPVDGGLFFAPELPQAPAKQKTLCERLKGLFSF